MGDDPNNFVPKLARNFRNPPSPPFLKGGLGGFTENSSIRQHSLFGSGLAGLGIPNEFLMHMARTAAGDCRKII
jgi:hypothetical protein